MSTETEDFVDEEFLTAAEQSVEDVSSAEYEERETFESSGSETSNEAEPQEVIEPGRQAVLDQKGGESNDWQLEYKGDSGYHFDGQEVRDPDGNVWTNEDTALHQEMVAQWKEGGSAIFFLPDYREQTEDREILYVTQLILSEKGDVMYEIHKHETIYPKEEEAGEENEAYAAALAELRLDTVEDSHETHEIESPADTLMSIETAEVLGVNDSELVEVADEINQEEIVPAIATESVESVADNPVAEEIPAVASSTENGEQNDAPDPWLVELLKFDALDPVEPHDDAVAESDVPREAIREGTETFDLRAILGSEPTAELDSSPDIAAVAHNEVEVVVHEPGSVNAAESPVAVMEMAGSIPLAEAPLDTREEVSQGVIVDVANDIETVAQESIVEQPISIMAIGEKMETTFVDTVRKLSKPKDFERSDEILISSEVSLTSVIPKSVEVHAPVDAIVGIQEPLQDVIAREPAAIQTKAAEDMSNDVSETEIITNALAIAEHSIAPESVEIPNALVVLHEVVDVQIQEPAAMQPLAEEHEFVQGAQIADKSVETKSPANDNEQPAPLQNAETILRALGISLPTRSPELVALKGLSSMPRGMPPSQQTRTGTNRFRSSVRSRSRDGVILEMAA